jgi:biotin carboxylase
MKKKILILGASALQLPAIMKSKEMNLFVLVLDQNPNAIGVKYADAFEPISTVDTNKILEAAKRYEVDAIITIASDRPMLSIAYVCKELNLHSISVDTALKATNKYLMRNVLKNNHIPIPYYTQANTFNEYEEALKSLHKKKLIIKPVDNSGSRGVLYLQTSTDDINEEDFIYTKNYSKSGTILIEEYLEGPEVSVETITYNGVTEIIAITDKLTTGKPYFVELGHCQPSILSNKIKNQIKKIAIKTVEAIGLVFGPSHIEMIVTHEGPKIVEIGARMGGDNITSSLVPLSTGVDMMKNTIEISLGIRPTTFKRSNQGAAIRYFNFKVGIIESIEYDFNDAVKSFIIEFSLNLKPNDKIPIIKNSNDRYGYVICIGKTANDAINNCEKVIRAIKINYQN